MQYITREGIKYEISSPDEQKMLNWLMDKSKKAASWLNFENYTANAVIETAKKTRTDWQNHPLYKIQLDLVARIGIRTGELSGEISDVL